MNKLRTLAIVDDVKQRKYCSSGDLAVAFGVSTATIQRDIAEIVRKDALRKVHGGVAAFDVESPLGGPAANPHFSERIEANQSKKVQIAEIAIRQIADEDILFLDSSTTALFLARRLQKADFYNITIVTNSVLIIQEFHLFPPHFIPISIGGSFNFQLNSFLGHTAFENLRQWRIYKAFFSSVGMNRSGVYTYHENHAEFLKQLLGMADSSYLLLDSSKFSKTALFPICSPGEIGHLITDAAPPKEVCDVIPDVIFPQKGHREGPNIFENRMDIP